MSTRLKFYPSGGSYKVSYGMSASSTGNKPMAEVVGRYNNASAVVHVHLTPDGTRYDAYSGAHVKPSADSSTHLADWGSGRVTSHPDLKAILDAVLSSWSSPGEYSRRERR